MPVIQVTLIEGYDASTRQSLCQRLTDAAMATIHAPAEAVTVAITEVAPAGYMRGRTSRTPGPAQEPPASLCLDFLEALEQRDLERARALIGPGFAMTFPGGVRFEDFGDLITWASTRYAAIAKTIERVEEALLGDTVAVYVSGTLRGTRPDGTAFQGIRFIDRFSVQAGHITGQDVWNDLAECGVTGA